MIKSLDPKQLVDFVSSLDTGDKNTVFKIGIASGRDRITLVANFEERDVRGYYDLIKAGLKGIVNLNGKDYEKITDEVLDLIPTPILKELFTEITKLNLTSGQELKN
jgi:hypothetical protein